MNYYNEIDKNAAAWLQDLIDAGLIPAGHVDTRSITDVEASDLRGYTQCHFFAGIGGWAYALQLAGVPADRPLWTGSCPCQSFSAAGKQKGFDDERHLWPAWFELIRQCRPPVVFGEQVAAAINHGWLDLVSADLEREGYAVGSAVLPACGIGAPHKRERLWFGAQLLAGSNATERRADLDGRHHGDRHQTGRNESNCEFGECGEACELADMQRNGHDWSGCGRQTGRIEFADGGEFGWMDDSSGTGCKEQPGIGRVSRQAHDGGAWQNTNGSGGVGDPEGFAHEFGNDGGLAEAQRPLQGEAWQRDGEAVGASGGNVLWSNADWIYCADEKYRPIEPGTFPLAYGLPAGMGKLPEELRSMAELAGLDAESLRAAKAYRTSALKGYGNAICPQTAQIFIEAFMEYFGI